MMALSRSRVLKQLLVASSASTSLGLRHPPALTTHPRGFTTTTTKAFISAGAGVIGRLLLNFKPHTLCTTTRVIQEGEGEAGIQVAGKHPKVSFGEGPTFSLSIPGREKIHETPQGLRVFIDLGLDKMVDDDDLDDQSVKVTKLYKTLFIRGYAQKHGIRKNYSARVKLPTTTKQPIKTEIKDGGLLVTLPPVGHSSQAGQSCLRTIKPFTHH